MNLSLSPLPVKNTEDKKIKQIQFSLDERLADTRDRIEVAGDAICLKQLPLVYTEECVAPGARADLL